MKNPADVAVVREDGTILPCARAMPIWTYWCAAGTLAVLVADNAACQIAAAAANGISIEALTAQLVHPNENFCKCATAALYELYRLGGFTKSAFFRRQVILVSLRCSAAVNRDTARKVLSITASASSAFQRQLILLAKVLQSLANDVDLVKREAWMAPMQDLLSENKKHFEDLFDEMSALSDSEIQEIDPSLDVPEVPEFLVNNSAIQVLEVLAQNRDGTVAALDDEQSLIDSMQSLCGRDVTEKLPPA